MGSGVGFFLKNCVDPQSTAMLDLYLANQELTTLVTVVIEAQITSMLQLKFDQNYLIYSLKLFTRMLDKANQSKRMFAIIQTPHVSRKLPF